MRVSIVLDQNFVDQTPSRLGDAFWLIESPANRALARKLWDSGRFDPNSAVFHGEPSEEAAVGMYAVVDLHHPDWQQLEFFGVEMGDIVLAGLRDAEALELSLTVDGFVAVRPEHPDP